MSGGVGHVEDVTQLAWGKGLVDELNAFLVTARLDNMEVDQIIVVEGKYMAVKLTDIYTPDAGLGHYDRHYQGRS
jgi:hypothetical protein